MSVKEVAEFLGFRPLTVRRMIYRGQLSGRKINGRLRIRTSDVRALVKRAPVVTQPAREGER